MASANKAAECAECAALRSQQGVLRAELDRALTELARERERAAATAFAPPDPALRDLRVGHVPGAPLRYVLADQVNDGIKRWLGPVHTAVRGLLGAVRRRDDVP